MIYMVIKSVNWRVFYLGIIPAYILSLIFVLLLGNDKFIGATQVLIKKLFKTIAITTIFLAHWNCFADTVIEIEAQPSKGFEFPFFLKIPDKMATTTVKYLLVETNNTGAVSDDLDVHFQNAKKAIVGNAVGPWIAKKLRFPILIPAFPRPETQWQIYTHALDRDTMLVESGKLKRLDLQLLAMIAEAKNILKKQAIDVADKIILTGCSASASLANRFSMLHPESTQVVVAGGLNGILMLPVKQYNQQTLNYPLGINDFSKIAGKTFDKEKWAAVPQFLFMGEHDTNDAVKYDDAYSDIERAAIHQSIGKVMQPNRWRKCQEIYQQHNVNVVFHTYKDIGHGTNLAIHTDILNFIKENI